MTIHGLPTPIHDPRASRAEERPAAPLRDRQPAHAGAAAAPAEQMPLPSKLVQRPSAVIPAEAPAGTDPELWSVLTSEERAYFARTASTGPLTYSKMMTQGDRPTAGLPRGGRVDVRV